MFNFKTKLLSAIFACLLFASPVSAEFFSDVILTGTQGIWMDSRSYASLQHAITAAGASDREIVIIGAQAATTLVVPANVRLKFLRDGSINNTDQLTINTRNIAAEDRQIFTGAGDIDFVDGSVVRSSWFSNAVEALDVTLDDTLTMVISETGRITANSAVGNNVTLKWESSDNHLIVYGGRVLSNVKGISAENYQIFAGAGDIDFLDGTELYLSWFRRLRSVLTWVEAEEVTIIVNEDSTVDYTQVSTANENIRITPGGVLTLPAGITLTLNGVTEVAPNPFALNATATLNINGPFKCGLYQAIPTTGTVNFGASSVRTLYHVWWGMVEGTGIAAGDRTTNTTALQAAITAAAEKTLEITAGTWEIDSALAVTNRTDIVGAPGFNGTVLIQTAAAYIIEFAAGGSASRFGNFMLQSPCGGVRLTDCHRAYFYNLWGGKGSLGKFIHNVGSLLVKFEDLVCTTNGHQLLPASGDMWGYGLYFEASATYPTNQCVVNNAIIEGTTSDGLFLTINSNGWVGNYAGGIKVYGSTFEGCGDYGANIDGSATRSVMSAAFYGCHLEQNDGGVGNDQDLRLDDAVNIAFSGGILGNVVLEGNTYGCHFVDGCVINDLTVASTCYGNSFVRAFLEWNATDATIIGRDNYVKDCMAPGGYTSSNWIGTVSLGTGGDVLNSNGRFSRLVAAGSVADGYASYGGATVAVDIVNYYSFPRCMKVTAVGVAALQGMTYVIPHLAVENNDWITVSYMMYKPAGLDTDPGFFIDRGAANWEYFYEDRTIVPDNTWVHYSRNILVSSYILNIVFTPGNTPTAGQFVYFDDITIMRGKDSPHTYQKAANFQDEYLIYVEGNPINTTKRITIGTAAPVAGNYMRGDIVFNYTPIAGGTVGWVCTADGTPGTWNTFGDIAP